MIFDTLKEWNRYADLHPRFREGFAFLVKATEEGYPVGKYEISGSELYAMVQEYDTKLPEDCLYEGHER